MALLRVHDARVEVVSYVEGVQVRTECLEDLASSIVRITFDYRQGTMFGSEKTDGFDYAPQETRQKWETLAYVEGEEVLDCRGVGVVFVIWDFEIFVAGRVEGRAFEAWECLVIGMDYRMDVSGTIRRWEVIWFGKTVLTLAYVRLTSRNQLTSSESFNCHRLGKYLLTIASGLGRGWRDGGCGRGR